MKIRFLKDTNIRSDHQALEKAPIGVVYADTVLEVEDFKHEGARVNGNAQWWRDQNGWYYWTGETEILALAQTEIPSPPPTNPEIIPIPETVSDPIPPPVEAIDLVALPIPADQGLSENEIPEGEWRLVRNGVSITPEKAQTT